MTTLVLEFMQPTRLWALLLIPVIAGVYWYLANRIPQSRTPNSRLRFVIPKDADLSQPFQGYKRSRSVCGYSGCGGKDRRAHV